MTASERKLYDSLRGFGWAVVDPWHAEFTLGELIVHDGGAVCISCGRGAPPCETWPVLATFLDPVNHDSDCAFVALQAQAQAADLTRERDAAHSRIDEVERDLEEYRLRLAGTLTVLDGWAFDPTGPGVLPSIASCPTINTAIRIRKERDAALARVAALEREVERWKSVIGVGTKEDAERIAELEATLEFYADPGTYFGWGMFADSPAGDWDSDFEETDLGLKPGKRARAALSRGEGGHG